MTGKTAITIEFDQHALSTYADERLAMLWHLAQANPADGFRDPEPGELAMRIGWEIIRRWLGTVPPEMYHHQQDHYASWQLGRFARRTDDGLAPRMVPDSPELREALTAKLTELHVWASKPGGSSLTREQIAQELTTIVMTPQDQDGTADEAASQ